MEGISVDKHFFDATAIAKHLGIFSKSGEPHKQAVAAIITKLDIGDDEKEIVPFQNQGNGHSGTNWQYAETVVQKVGQWIRENGFPNPIPGNGRKYTVVYREAA